MTSSLGDDNVRLSIWLVSFPADPPEGPARPAPLERLQRAFGINAAMAQQFLDQMPLVVKRHASKEEAKGYVQTLIRIGAEVRVEPEEAPAPVAAPVAAPSASAPIPAGTMLGRIALSQSVAPMAPARPRDESLFEPEPPTGDFDPGESAIPLEEWGEELPAEGFGVEEDWDALMPEPEAAPQPPVHWPDDMDDMEVMLAKGAEAPARERDPHDHNMLSLDAASLSDPGLLGTEEYQAVMQLNRDLAPSVEEDGPIALLDDDLPSNPFGPPLGGPLPPTQARERPARAPSRGLGELPMEARLPELDEELGAELAEDALPSLSELAPASGDIGRKDVLRSFDEAEAGAGLPSAPLPGAGAATSPARFPTGAPSPGTPRRMPTPAPLPPRHLSEAPPRRPTQPDAPALGEQGDGRSFWGAIGVALVAPVRGKGILWLPLIALMQIMGGCFLSFPCLLTQLVVGLTFMFLFLGLLGNYFGASVRKGLERDASAPELPELDAGVLKTEVASRGAVLGLLALILFAIPTGAGYYALQGAGPDPAAIQSRSWDPEEPFFDDKGARVEVKFGESARVLTDQRGDEVLVNPSGDKVEVLTRKGASAPSFSKGRLALFFVLLLVPLFYWPMALTVAALGGGFADIFNPITVGKGIVLGGARYAAVAGLSALIFAVGMIGVSMAAVSEMAAGTGGVASALCGALTPLFLYAYIHGVQGQLIGRMIAEQQDEFSELLS